MCPITVEQILLGFTLLGLLALYIWLCIFNIYGKQGKISTEFFLNSVRGSANY